MMDSCSKQLRVRGLYSASGLIQLVKEKETLQLTEQTNRFLMLNFLLDLSPTVGRKIVDKLIEGGKITLEENYEVDYIVDHVNEKGVDYYLIKWQGWSGDYNSWEPVEHLTDCEDIVQEFHRQRALERPASRSNKRSRSKCCFEPETKRRRAQELLDHIHEYNHEITAVDLLEAWRKAIGPEVANRMVGRIRGRRGMPRFIRTCSGAAVVKKGSKSYKKRRQETLRALQTWEQHLNDINTDPASIVVENNVDLEGPPQNFRYINDYIPGEGVELHSDPVVGCDCENCIMEKKSCCASSAGGWPFAYYTNGRLRLGKGHPIYECNKKCKCGPKCPNRVVQHGRKYKMCIYRTNNGRGWGVRTQQMIKKGAFVMEYVGEVITYEEAERRGKEYDAEGMTYLFDLDFQDTDSDCPYTVDAGIYGNVSHFVNHSCDPNLVVHVVWINNLDPRLPRIALFASRDIKKGEELTFDYQMTGDMTEEDDKQVTSNLVTRKLLSSPQPKEKTASRDLDDCDGIMTSEPAALTAPALVSESSSMLSDVHSSGTTISEPSQNSAAQLSGSMAASSYSPSTGDLNSHVSGSDNSQVSGSDNSQVSGSDNSQVSGSDNSQVSGSGSALDLLSTSSMLPSQIAMSLSSPVSDFSYYSAVEHLPDENSPPVEEQCSKPMEVEDKERSQSILEKITGEGSLLEDASVVLTPDASFVSADTHLSGSSVSSERNARSRLPFTSPRSPLGSLSTNIPATGTVSAALDTVVSSTSATGTTSTTDYTNTTGIASTLGTANTTNTDTTNTVSSIAPISADADSCNSAIKPDTTDTIATSTISVNSTASNTATPNTALASTNTTYPSTGGYTFPSSPVSTIASSVVSPSKRIKAKYEECGKKKNRILCLCGTAKCRKYLI